VHPNQITQWKKILLAEAEEVFASGKKPAVEPNVKELHAKIGQNWPWRTIFYPWRSGA